ncbi:MAG: AraC family transcriptional regulator [Sediminibacterium sp.]|nr:AraC family transcriptional regulator [Sediminibacterium sp.]
MAKPAKEIIQPDKKSSFRLKHSIIASMDSAWHFHEEYELLYIVKGYGHRIIGNHITDYRSGDMVFIGPNTPHVWKSPDHFYTSKKKSDTVEVICLQFNEHAFGSDFFSIPEMEHINTVLKKSRKGLSLTGETRNKISKILWRMLMCKDVERLILLMELLKILSRSTDYKTLSSVTYSSYSFHSETDRLEKVVHYTSKNFRNNISLNEISAHIGMSEAGFCKFFKKTTLKNFTEYLNEIRINHACQLLQNDKYSVVQVMHECGFRSLSHFNKTFKKQSKYTPLKYKALFRKTI